MKRQPSSAFAHFFQKNWTRKFENPLSLLFLTLLLFLSVSGFSQSCSTDTDCDDGLACTTDDCFSFCFPGFGCSSNCIIISQCDDGNFCTIDSCKPQGCTYTPLACDDGNPCTIDGCSNNECVNTLSGDPCLNPLVCCNDNDLCTVDTCDVNGVCVNIPKCTDSDPCTINTCNLGVCQTTPFNPNFCANSPGCCDDGDDCTVDFCSTSGANIFGTCTSSDTCTTSGTECSTDADCDDGLACTTDDCFTICFPGFGCTSGCIITSQCDDGNFCTIDSCSPGGCVYTPFVCDDSNPCTNDVCSNNACQYTFSVNPCLNPQVCCNDNDPCTIDTCDINGACANIPKCTDNDPCTFDACSLGVCQTTPFNPNFCANSPGCCDDGNDCTVDFCSTSGANIFGTCTSSDTCTTGGTECSTDADCDDGLACTTDDCFTFCFPGFGCSSNCIIISQCNDNNFCTVDSCSPGGCVYTPFACDDGNPCTIDGCSNNECVNTLSGNPCLNPAVCCNDGNVCTIDTCDNNGACVNLPKCTDNDPCTINTCDQGVCSTAPSNPNLCANNPSCCDDGNACTQDICATYPNPFGTCANLSLPNCCPTPCDDGVDCTVDACTAGVCTHSTAADFTPCTADANACTADFCSSGTCVHEGGHLDGSSCPDDFNSCTNDYCSGDMCIHDGALYDNTACADEGNVCTIDFCSGGVCQHQSEVLENAQCTSDGNGCTEDVCKSGSCEHILNCNDLNPCTLDACTGGTCTNTLFNCNDINACTFDVCNDNGTCTHLPTTCTDFNACTNDACDIVTGCFFVPKNCNDGDLCNGTETCNNSTGCVAGIPVNCNDNDPCTTNDRCLIDGTCTSTPKECDDNNPCTDDGCVNGQCEFKCSPAPFIQWGKSLGTISTEINYAVQQTPDGGYLAAGDAGLPGALGSGDGGIIRLNANGDTLWTRVIGTVDNDQIRAMDLTADGGFVVAGKTEFSHHGTAVLWVVKLNATGGMIWQKFFGGTAEDNAYAIIQTTDGGYLVAGTTTSTDGDVSGNHGGTDAWILRLKANGDTLWTKTFGGSQFDAATGVQQTADGNFIVTGNTSSNDFDMTGNHGASDAFVVKLDVNGDVIWKKMLGGTESDNANAIVANADGGATIAGISESDDGDVHTDHDLFNVWVVRLKANGDTTWTRTFGGSKNEGAFSINHTAGGGFILSGYSTSSDEDVQENQGSTDLLIVRIDADGNLVFTKTIGGSEGETGYSIQQAADGGYIVSGYSASEDGDLSTNNGIQDHWIVKLGSCQNVVAVDTAVCPGGRIFAGGSSQNQSGTYYDTLSSSGGCDSVIVVTTLTVLNCDDGNLCTQDLCTDGACTNVQIVCNDNNACNGVETCNPASGCVAGTPLNCNDGNPCTLDGCTGNACKYTALSGVTSFTLVNSTTDLDIRPVNSNDTIKLACTANINIRANVCGNVSSVRFKVNNNTNFRTESEAPFALNGDSPTGNYNNWNPAPGVYTLTATPYTGTGATGTAGTPLTITVRVLANTVPCIQCTSAAQCNDNNACTIDACNAGACTNTAKNCNDSNACTSDLCDGSGNCVNTLLNCNDNNLCTIDNCIPASGCSYTSITCNDNNLCTVDACNTATGCVFQYVCNDNNACTIDNCNPSIGCSYTSAGNCCTSNSQCNDNNPCTIDACNNGNCVFTNAGIRTVTSFTLVNSANDNDIMQIDNGSVINLAQYPNINVRANLCTETGTESIRFKLNSNTNFRTENDPPYALVGDAPPGDYHKWNVTPGQYTITATPWSGNNATATMGTAKTITIQIVNNPLKTSGEENGVAAVEESEVKLSAYPNPFSEKLNIEFTLPENSKVKLEIFSVTGQRLASLFEGDVSRGELKKFEYNPAVGCDCIVIYRLQTAQGTYHEKGLMVR